MGAPALLFLQQSTYKKAPSVEQNHETLDGPENRLLISSAAMAEGECQADRQKFCKDVAKSDVGACFDKHAAELSEACKAKREARAKKNAGE